MNFWKVLNAQNGHLTRKVSFSPDERFMFEMFLISRNRLQLPVSPPALVHICTAKRARRVLHFFDKNVTFFDRPLPYILSNIARTSKDHKNITKGRRNILRPVLESLWSILSEYHICINKIMNFDAFL